MMYLATPFAHPDPAVRQKRKIQAIKTTNLFVRNGHHVFCPIAYGSLLKAGTKNWSHAQWMAFDIQFLLRCNSICVVQIEGWDKSNGIAEELELMRSYNQQVFFTPYGSIKLSNRPHY